MDNFVVSARKYRPATFDTVVGQQHITSTLKNAIATKHLAQAFLFCGPRGVGKTTCARILAKTINCENLQEDGEACGSCVSCKSYQNNTSFNIHELDAASNNSVDDIRNLTEQVRIPPQYGHYKVYIIDEVHMLSTAAFNAFLKTLEEPPSYAIFILATTEKHKILPTILSRCQIFDFNRIKISDIANQLAKVAESEGIGYEEEGLRVIAQKADGGLRDALSMFDMIATFSHNRSITYQQVIANLHILDSEYYFKVIDAALEGKSPDLLLIFNEILQKGFDGHLFLLGLAEHLRNLIIAADPQTHALLEIGEEFISQFLHQSSKASTGYFLNLLNLVCQTEIAYKTSKNARLLVELCLLKMANMKVALSTLEEKKKSDSSVITQSFKAPQVATISDIKTQPLKREAFKSIPSIKDLSQNKSVTSGNSENALTQAKKEKRNLDQSGWQEAKEAYIEWLKNEKQLAVSAWQLAKSETLEGLKVHLIFTSEITLEAFEKELPGIAAYFQEGYTSVPEFTYAYEEPADEDYKPYSNQEKFKYLQKKYPKLSELRAILGLEAD